MQTREHLLSENELLQTRVAQLERELAGLRAKQCNVDDATRLDPEQTRVDRLLQHHVEQSTLGMVEWDEHSIDITDLKRSDRDLRTSEQQNRVILENVPDHVFILDQESKVRYVNHLPPGYQHDQIVGRPFRDFARPEFQEVIDLALAQVLTTGTIAEREFTDITGRRFSARWSPFDTTDHEVQSILAVVTDITDQRTAEDMLRLVSEGTARTTGAHFFDSLVRHLATALGFRVVTVARIDETMTRAKTIALWTDDRLADSVEYDLAGTPCENVVHQSLCFYPDKVQERFPRDAKLVEMGVESYIGTPLVGSTGKTLGLLAALDDDPMDDRPALRATLEIFADRGAAEIERTVAKEQFRDSEERFRTLATHAPVGIATIDAAGSAIYVNPECSRIVGMSEDECLGAGWTRGLHPDDRARVISEWAQAVKTGAPYSSDHRFQLSNGDVRWTRVLGVPHSNESNDVVGWFSMALDVTEKQQAKARLDEQRAMLAHASRLSTMGEMMAGIAHEINQPLNAISNFASACRNTMATLDCQFRAPIEPWLRQISQQAVRCGDIIRGLRAFVEKGEDERTWVDLNNVVHDSITLVSYDIDPHSISIDCRLPNPGPLVFANKVQLQQVLVNLLRNACDAVGESTAPEIRISAEAQNGHVRLSVQDNGPGIEGHQRETLFTPFVTTKPEGLGMGLAISRSIIEAHHGHLRLDTGASPGAVFHIELPLSNIVQV